MRLKYALAAVLCSLVCSTAKADLISVIVDGNPLPRGATLPSGAVFSGVVKNPGQDFLLLLYTTPPAPPAPPTTFRVVRPDGGITVIPNSTLFVQPPKQVGGFVEIQYKSESHPLQIKGSLLTPGTPNPTTENDSIDQQLFGPEGFLNPTDALQGITEIINQAETSLVFGSPIPLSYFNYDFNGTADFPAFVGGVTFVAATGSSDFVGFVPEPATSTLLMAPLAAALLYLARKRARFN